MSSNIGVYQTTEQVLTGTTSDDTAEYMNQTSSYQLNSHYLVPDENIKNSTSDFQVSGNVYETCD